MRASSDAARRLGGSSSAIPELITSSAITMSAILLEAVHSATLVAQQSEDPLLEPTTLYAEGIPGARWSSLPGMSTWPSLDAAPSSTRSFLAHVQIASNRVLRNDPLHQPGSLDKRSAQPMVNRHAYGSSSNTTPPCDVERHPMPETRHRPQQVLCSLRRAQRSSLRASIHILAARARSTPAWPRRRSSAGGRKPRGIAVNVAARVSGLGGGGDFVTATLATLVAQSGPAFEAGPARAEETGGSAISFIGWRRASAAAARCHAADEGMDEFDQVKRGQDATGASQRCGPARGGPGFALA